MPWISLFHAISISNRNLSSERIKASMYWTIRLFHHKSFYRCFGQLQTFFPFTLTWLLINYVQLQIPQNPIFFYFMIKAIQANDSISCRVKRKSWRAITYELHISVMIWIVWLLGTFYKSLNQILIFCFSNRIHSKPCCYLKSESQRPINVLEERGWTLIKKSKTRN